MEFPLIKEKDSFTPQDGLCPWCKNVKVLEPNSFAMLSAGAMLYNEDTDSWRSSDQLMGYLGLTWHGAHTDEGGEGIMPNTTGNLKIAHEIQGGQLGLMFCSIKCLREFLMHSVDMLEKSVKGC